MPRSHANSTSPTSLPRDFWIYWTGQAISSLGSSITWFALPLLVYELTGSAVNLAISTAANLLPYLLFGLLIGAWADRTDRRRLMMAADIGRASVIGTIPVAFSLGHLTVWWIYVAGFIGSTFSIGFDSAAFAAVPSLVTTDDLVAANGRIQSSFAVARVLGPLVGGLLLTVISIPNLLVFDACSFALSTVSLVLIRRSFNPTTSNQEAREPLHRTMVEGLRYVLSHPVLRAISIMMALINFFGTTVRTQLVLFASVRLGADRAHIGWLFSAGALGVVAFTFFAGRLRKRWSFSALALGVLTMQGILITLFAFNSSYWPGVVLWASISGSGVLFNVTTSSLRQAIVPNEMLGRVASVAMVVAWSAIPIGSMLGGAVIQWTDRVSWVYGGVGVLTALIALSFSLTALGRADRYLPAEDADNQFLLRASSR